MSFQEKSTWIMLGLVTLVYGWYFAVVFSEIGDTSIAAVAYRGVMLVTVIALVVFAVIAHILVAVASPKDADKTDERDRDINRFGEYVGSHVLGFGAVTAMGLAMFEIEHFWIANTILAGLVLSEIVSGLTKVTLYRRGY